MAQENTVHPRSTWLRWVLGALAALALLALVAPVVDARAAGVRARGGVTLGARSVARHDRAELEADATAYARLLDARKLEVRLGWKHFALAPRELGLHLDVRGTVARALAAGNDGGFVRRALGYWRRLSQPVAVSPVVVLDRARLRALAETWEAQALADRPFEGGLAVSGTTITELPPKPGHRVAMTGAARALLAAYVASGSHACELPLEVAPAPLPADAAREAANEARALLAGPITLSSPDTVAPGAATGAATPVSATPVSATPVSATFAPAELAPLVSTARDGARLRLDLVADRLAKLTEALRKSVERDPVDARFVVSPAGAISIVPSAPGVRVELARLPAVLLAAAKDPARRGELPLVHEPEPALTTERARELGIKGLVSSFTTRHPCCQKRVENIHHIADLLDGRLVLPGETMSVNKVVGPRTLKAGFVMAPTIEEGEMVDSPGGGISQFATTFFNALFHGGYDIIERQPHSYWFPRYPMGHEATLSWPEPDLIFRNDTAAGLLIKTSYTATSITVKLYGDNGGRKVTAHVSERQNIVPAPLEILPNPNVSPDEEHVKEPGSIGWSVIVSRVVTFADGTNKEERRRVTYKARPRRVELHPCRIPPGEKGYTGEPCPVPPASEEDASGSVAEP